MHIEKNVFDNIIGTILGLEGKTKDDSKARAALQKQGVRKHLWQKFTGSSSRKEKVSQPTYTVLPNEKVEILEMMRDAKYPHGYAGCLKNKINVRDKKFIGLKTHDCHVMLQRLLPVVIRPYLPKTVLDPLISLSIWFQKLCCRELKKLDVIQMKTDIVIILCKLEQIFPPPFFTIMVHLLIHLPDQVLLKGPVHYNWMYPMERQLGEYKKYVRNTRYPEGCIAEQYIAHECVTYCRLYMDDTNAAPINVGSVGQAFKLSVVSDLIKLLGHLRRVKLSKTEIATAHWHVVENCSEVSHYYNSYKDGYWVECPDSSYDEYVKDFHRYFLGWVHELQNAGDDYYKPEVHNLAFRPQTHACYSQCHVNGIKFVIYDRDCKLKTQNSGVMVKTSDKTYYGILENIIQLKYAQGMPVVVFKCKWFNTSPYHGGGIKSDHGLISVDTSSVWYENSPYCLAIHAIQVFYLDDPKAGYN